MILTWKDAATTGLAITAAGLAYSKYLGWQNFLTAPRVGIVALGLLGIAMCSLGSPNWDSKAWMSILATLGALATVLVIFGLITGYPWVFYALTGNILALWLLSTLRHTVAAA